MTRPASSSPNVLDTIARRYHGKDTLRDKHIEDMCQRHTFDWVLAQIAGAKQVLELGYGEGLFTAILAKQVSRLTVIEGSALLVKKAKKKYGRRVRVVHSMFEAFEPTVKFDAIVATHVLEHVDDPVGLLRRMRRWLTPRGKLVVIVPNSESIHRRLAVLMDLQPRLDTLGARDRLVGHQRVYSLTGLRRDLRAGGFGVSRTDGFFLKVLPNSMMLDYDTRLLEALNAISEFVPGRLLANIGAVATPR
jgi:SAM-dependent methyltransferase